MINYYTHLIDWMRETPGLQFLIKTMHYYLNHKFGFGFLLVLLIMPGVQYMFFVFSADYFKCNNLSLLKI